jgi:hypothetical protein
MAGWWSAANAGLYAGIAGLMIGLSIGLIVTALRVLAPRGIGRTPVLIALYALTFAGGAALGTGALAVILHQPAHVWLPLIAAGGVLSVASGALIPISRLAYRRARTSRVEPGVLG